MRIYPSMSRTVVGIALVGLAAVLTAPAHAAPKTSRGPRTTAKKLPKARTKRKSKNQLRYKKGLPVLDIPSPGATAPGEPEFTGPTLGPGDKAELSPTHPYDKGVGLFARKGAGVATRGLLGTPEPVYYFRAGGGSYSTKESVGFELASSPLEGDDLKVVCLGKFSSKLDVTVAMTSMKMSGGGGAHQRIDASNGKAKFFVHGGNRDPWGVYSVYFSATGGGLFELHSCTVERDPD